MISHGEMKFNSDTHEYMLDGEKYISVTQLMKKHGLSTDYGSVPEQVLRSASERGSLIHKEIEQYVKQKEVGFTSECEDYIRLCKDNNLQARRSEFIVYDKQYKIAGTVDLYGYFTDKIGWFLGDIKTTSTLNKDALSWQLSLYEYIASANNGDIDEEDDYEQEVFMPEKYYGFHLLSDGKSKLVEVEKQPWNEVISLLESERMGRLYQKPQLTLIESEINEVMRAQALVEEIETRLKSAKKQKERQDEILLRMMKEGNVKKFETDNILITYIAPSTRTAIDTEKLKTEAPETYRQYSKTSDVCERVKVTLRKQNNGNAS